jgi:hypothetical protein
MELELATQKKKKEKSCKAQKFGSLEGFKIVTKLFFFFFWVWASF